MTNCARIIAALQGHMGRAKRVTIGRVLARDIILILTEQRKEIEKWKDEYEKLKKGSIDT